MKAEIESWLSSPDKISKIFFYLLILFLPTQLGRHFWPNFSFVYGLRIDYLSPTLYTTDILVFLIFLFFIPRFIKYLRNIKREYFLLFVFFLMSLVIGIATSKNPLAGLFGFIKLLEFLFLGIYVYLSFPFLNKKIYSSCILTALIFESLLSFLQYLNQGSLGGIFYFLGERTFNAQTPGIANASINGQLVLRPYATFSHPNVLAAFLMLSMLYLIMFSPKETYWRIILSVGLFLGTASLFLTLSRVPIVLWCIFLLSMLVVLIDNKLKRRKTPVKVIVLSFFFLILSFTYLLLFNNTFVAQRLISTRLTDESFTQRKELLDQSISMFEKAPVFGIGINNFYNNLNFRQPSTEALLIQPVHNVFSLILSETGIIGILTFICVLLLLVIRLTKQGIRKTKYLLLMLFAIITLGMFDHYFLTLQQGQLLLAIFLGTAFSYKKT